jgi:hypothetical protein
MPPAAETAAATEPPTAGEAPASQAPGDGAGLGGGFLSKVADLALQALPAVVSAAGFLGFVAFVGAAIEWVRFSAAGLPADQAVRVIPRQELVTIGAVALVGYTAAALLAVLVVYLVDREGNATVATLRGLVAVALVEMLVTLFFIRATGTGYLLLVAWLLAVALLASGSIAHVISNVRQRASRAQADDDLREARRGWDEAQDALARAEFARTVASEQGLPSGPQPEPPVAQAGPRWWPPFRRPPAGQGQQASAAAVQEADEAVRAARIAAWSAQQRWDEALKRWIDLASSSDLPVRVRELADLLEASAPPTAVDLEARLRRAEAPRGSFAWSVITYPLRTFWSRVSARTTGRWWYAAALLILAGAVIAGFVLVVHFKSSRWLLVMFAVAVLLATMNLGIARATQRFVWYGLSVFFSVLLFGVALTIARTMRSPEIQPVALLRKSSDAGICGVYITETGKRVYMGWIQADGGDVKHGTGRIFWVPLDDVELVSVGPLQKIEDARGRGPGLLADAYGYRAQERAAAVKPTTKTIVVGTKPTGQSPGTQTTTVSETPVNADRPANRPTQDPPAACTKDNL